MASFERTKFGGLEHLRPQSRSRRARARFLRDGDRNVPINERHLRRVLAEWVAHYNRGVHTRAWVPAFLIFRPISSRRSHAATRFAAATVSLPSGCSAACITSTVSIRCLHERVLKRVMNILRTTGTAREQRIPVAERGAGAQPRGEVPASGSLERGGRCSTRRC
jgi:hypothetical protein